MQIVIDVSEEEYASCKKHFENLGKREVINDYEYAIANGTPLPEKATNGDVIKAMFPNIDFHEMSFTVHGTTKVTSNGIKGNISYDFWKDWWNAQYKADKEE